MGKGYIRHYDRKNIPEYNDFDHAKAYHQCDMRLQLYRFPEINDKVHQLVEYAASEQAEINKLQHFIRVECYEKMVRTWPYLGMSRRCWIDTIGLRRLQQHHNLTDDVASKIRGSLNGGKRDAALRTAILNCMHANNEPVAYTYEGWRTDKLRDFEVKLPVPSVDSAVDDQYDNPLVLDNDFIALLDECAKAMDMIDTVHAITINVCRTAFEYTTEEPGRIFDILLDVHCHSVGGFPAKSSKPCFYGIMSKFRDLHDLLTKYGYATFDDWARRFGMNIEYSPRHPARNFNGSIAKARAFSKHLVFKIRKDRLEYYPKIEDYHHCIVLGSQVYLYLWDTREMVDNLPVDDIKMSDITTDFVDNFEILWPGKYAYVPEVMQFIMAYTQEIDNLYGYEAEMLPSIEAVWRKYYQDHPDDPNNPAYRDQIAKEDEAMRITHVRQEQSAKIRLECTHSVLPDNFVITKDTDRNEVHRLVEAVDVDDRAYATARVGYAMVTTYGDTKRGIEPLPPTPLDEYMNVILLPDKQEEQAMNVQAEFKNMQASAQHDMLNDPTLDEQTAMLKYKPELTDDDKAECQTSILDILHRMVDRPRQPIHHVVRDQQVVNTQLLIEMLVAANHLYYCNNESPLYAEISRASTHYLNLLNAKSVDDAITEATAVLEHTKTCKSIYLHITNDLMHASNPNYYLPVFDNAIEGFEYMVQTLQTVDNTYKPPISDPAEYHQYILDHAYIDNVKNTDTDDTVDTTDTTDNDNTDTTKTTDNTTNKLNIE